MRAIYATSFCNFGHDVLTGRPVGHECYVLHPEDLRIEARGSDAEVSALCSRGRGMRKQMRDGLIFGVTQGYATGEKRDRKRVVAWTTGDRDTKIVRGRNGRNDLSLSEAIAAGVVVDTGIVFKRVRLAARGVL